MSDGLSVGGDVLHDYVLQLDDYDDAIHYAGCGRRSWHDKIAAVEAAVAAAVPAD